jgi:hypothetical protein
MKNHKTILWPKCKKSSCDYLFIQLYSGDRAYIRFGNYNPVNGICHSEFFNDLKKDIYDEFGEDIEIAHEGRCFVNSNPEYRIVSLYSDYSRRSIPLDRHDKDHLIKSKVQNKKELKTNWKIVP